MLAREKHDRDGGKRRGSMESLDLSVIIQWYNSCNSEDSEYQRSSSRPPCRTFCSTLSLIQDGRALEALGWVKALQVGIKNVQRASNRRDV